jgi:hypothetical protein
MSIPDLPNIKAELLDVPSMDKLAPQGGLDHPPRILMLYGSLRERSFSRFLTYEAARILEHFGAEVKIANGWQRTRNASQSGGTAGALPLVGRPGLVQSRAAWRHHRRDEKPD